MCDGQRDHGFVVIQFQNLSTGRYASSEVRAERAGPWEAMTSDNDALQRICWLTTPGEALCHTPHETCCTPTCYGIRHQQPWAARTCVHAWPHSTLILDFVHSVSGHVASLSSGSWIFNPPPTDLRGKVRSTAAHHCSDALSQRSGVIVTFPTQPHEQRHLHHC